MISSSSAQYEQARWGSALKQVSFPNSDEFLPKDVQMNRSPCLTGIESFFLDHIMIPVTQNYARQMPHPAMLANQQLHLAYNRIFHAYLDEGNVFDVLNISLECEMSVESRECLGFFHVISTIRIKDGNVHATNLPERLEHLVQGEVKREKRGGEGEGGGGERGMGKQKEGWGRKREERERREKDRGGKIT